MESTLQIQEQLLEFVCRNYMVERDDVIPDESLVDQGIIDSFGLVEISGYIQKEFGIVVVDSEMNRANFGSIVKISNFVEKKRNS
ncbi:MAG: acyl carrier protein [Chitinispirillaceae bacterium]|nr:acyl carrier protein [Chitinispirillaceae bacterium]